MKAKTLLRPFLAAGLALHLAGALAAGYPQRPITMVAPFAAGGSTDATARLLAEGLGKELGQTVVVDNRPGAGGNIGAAIVAKAQPDGYTLLLATSTHATNVTLYGDKIDYSLTRDLVPVSQTAFIPNVLVVNAESGPRTLDELIARIRKGEAETYYGSAGNGSSQHLSGALFNQMVGGKMTHVPYKGGAPANQDLLAGRIQVIFSPLVEVLPYIEGGKLRALAVTTAKRSPRLPDVPAVGESLPGYEVALWNGIFAPAGTPPEVVETLAGAVARVMKQDKIRDTFASQGTEPVGNTPREFARLLPGEIDKWGKMVKISGARID